MTASVISRVQSVPFMATPPPWSSDLFPATATLMSLRVEPSSISTPPAEFLLLPPHTRPPHVTCASSESENFL